MRTTIDKPQDRQRWLNARRPYIGASDIAALVGEHPFLTAAELAAAKLTGDPGKDNGAMRRGRYLEDAVASWWADERGVKLQEPGQLYIYGDTVCATLDRRVAGDTDIVEIKSAHGYRAEPERHWIHQVQAQMLCTGAPRAHIVALDSSMDLKTWTIDADPEHGQTLYRAAAAFLQYIHKGEMPPDVILTYRAAATLHPDVVTEVVELDDESVSWCRQLGQLQSRISNLQADGDMLKGMIGDRLGDAAEGVHDGRRIVTWRSTTRNLVDINRLRAELPDVAAEYLQSTTYRALRLVKEKR